MWLASAALAALPDIDEPLRTGAAASGDAAVVVGIEDYFVLPDVPYAVRDAQAFYDFAVYTRGIAPDRVKLLTGPVSRETLMSALEAAGKETAAGGTVFVYFAGHGAASPSTGERILLGADAQADLDVFQARAVTVDEVRKRVTAGGGSAVLVLDTCYSGKSRTGTDVVAGKRFAVPAYAAAASPHVIEWTAAGPDQWAGPLDAARHGAFTYLAVGAMRGWADGQRDGVRDGVVTMEEASLYVDAGLRSLQITDQKPERVGDGAVILSRGTEAPPALTAEPVTVAQPVPAPAVAYASDEAGQIQVACRTGSIYIDGVLHLKPPFVYVIRANLTPGPHVVEIRGLGIHKTLPVELPPGNQVRLEFRKHALTEIGRGPLER